MTALSTKATVRARSCFERPENSRVVASLYSLQRSIIRSRHPDESLKKMSVIGTSRLSLTARIDRPKTKRAIAAIGCFQLVQDNSPRHPAAARMRLRVSVCKSATSVKMSTGQSVRSRRREQDQTFSGARAGSSAPAMRLKGWRFASPVPSAPEASSVRRRWRGRPRDRSPAPRGRRRREGCAPRDSPAPV